MTMSLYLTNSLLHVLFRFRYSLHFVRLSLSISPLSVMSSHDLLVVLLLTTSHSRWCIYSYPSLSTFLQIHFLAGLEQRQLRSCGSARLQSELVSSFASIDCCKQISIPLNEVLWISYPIKWFIEQYYYVGCYKQISILQHTSAGLFTGLQLASYLFTVGIF